MGLSVRLKFFYIMTLRSHMLDLGQKSALMSQWHKLRQGSIVLSLYGPYASDTIWIACALDLLLDQQVQFQYPRMHIYVVWGKDSESWCIEHFLSGEADAKQHIADQYDMFDRA